MIENKGVTVILKLIVLFCNGNLIAMSEFRMTSYSMRSMCGAHINLKWKQIYTAELTFSTSHNTSTTTHLDKDLPGPSYSLQGSCDITVESWDFLNKLMVRFEEFRTKRNCSDASLELYDGLTNVATLEGFPSPACGHHRNILMSRSFVTSDKYLTIRLPGNSFHDDSFIFKLYITAFQDGRCLSYEYPCANGRCIMGGLACNGYNPCGDNSDCPLPTPQEVEDDSRPVMLAAIIALSVSIVLVILGAVVMCKCYRVRRKRRRQEYTQAADIQDSQPNGHEDGSVNYQRSESQIEAERQFAPPSYNSHPVYAEHDHEDDADIETGGESAIDVSCPVEECYNPNNTTPPDYQCVMEHREMFKVSDVDVDTKPDNTIT